MPAPKKPWPLRWIVIAIVVFIVPYTYITLRYRKVTPAYLPYEDTRARILAKRAGYERVTGGIERLADPSWSGPAAGHGVPGGLPHDLNAVLLAPVLLPASIGRVSAAPEVNWSSNYPIEFTCAMSDSTQQPESAQIYYNKGGDMFVIPSFERLSAGLEARTRDMTIAIEVPRRSIPAGRYRVTLVGARESKAWTLQVH